MSKAEFRRGYFETLTWCAVKPVTGMRRVIGADVSAIATTLRPEADAFYDLHRLAIEAGVFPLNQPISWHAGHELVFVRLGRRAAFNPAEWGAVAAAAMTASAQALTPFHLVLTEAGLEVRQGLG